MVQLSKFLDHPYTLKEEMHIASFTILTPEQTKQKKPVNPISVRYLLDNNPDDAIQIINSVLETSKTDYFNETYWFLTPQNLGNEREHVLTQTGVLKEIRELEKSEQLNPPEDMDSRNEFSSNFD